MSNEQTWEAWRAALPSEAAQAAAEAELRRILTIGEDADAVKTWVIINAVFPHFSAQTYEALTGCDPDETEMPCEHEDYLSCCGKCDDCDDHNTSVETTDVCEMGYCHYCDHRCSDN